MQTLKARARSRRAEERRRAHSQAQAPGPDRGKSRRRVALERRLRQMDWYGGHNLYDYQHVTIRKRSL